MHLEMVHINNRREVDFRVLIIFATNAPVDALSDTGLSNFLGDSIFIFSAIKIELHATSEERRKTR